jgi:peroxiredoxin
LGNQAPDFTLKDINGNDVTLSNFRGQTVLIYTWFISCPPCKQDLVFMHHLYAHTDGKSFTILTINTADSLVNIQDFVRANGYKSIFLKDLERIVDKKYCSPRPGAVPNAFLVSPDGILKSIKSGFFSDINDVAKFVGYEPPTPKASARSTSEIVDHTDVWQLNGLYSEAGDMDGGGRRITFKTLSPPTCRTAIVQYYVLPNKCLRQKITALAVKNAERNYNCHDNPSSRNISFYNIDTTYRTLYGVMGGIESITTSLGSSKMSYPNYLPSRVVTLNEYLSNAIFLGGILEYTENTQYHCLFSDTKNLLVIITDDDTVNPTIVDRLYYTEP